MPEMSQDPISAPPKTHPPPMLIRVSRQGINVNQRQSLALGGAALILFSLPAAFAAPSIPLALPMVVLGAVLVGLNAIWARRWLDGVLQRYPRIEQMAPDWVILQVSGRAKRSAADQGAGQRG